MEPPGDAPPRDLPLRDRAAGREEVTPVRVRYPEVDRMGVVHHVHYVEWFERGRTEFMRRAGVAYAGVEDEMGVMFPVVEVGARYRRPARYDEALEVRTRIGSLEGPRVRFDYRVVRPATGELLAEGFTVHAATGREGRPRRIPGPLLDALRAWAAGGDAA